MVVVVVVVVVTGGNVGREIRVILEVYYFELRSCAFSLAIPHRKFSQNSLENYHHHQRVRLRMLSCIYSPATCGTKAFGHGSGSGAAEATAAGF